MKKRIGAVNGAMVDKMNPLKLGSTWILQKCRHRWNNGTKVKLIEVDEHDLATYVVVDSNGMRYLVGEKNLKEVE